ncbi:MAG: dihydroneopterin aldolase [Verrucomicrobiae bacterium]|nr:dihydroneopterin aldolase [Verrucomicrobiae bacterium]
MATAQIRIQDLEAWCHIGVPESERAHPQRLLLDIGFETPTNDNDHIAATVDYFAVCQAALEVAQSRPRQLIETLARDVLAVLAERFPIRSARVRVRKFSVPGTGEVSVEIGGT